MTIRVEISHAARDVMRDVSDAYRVGEDVECLLMIGGKALIAQKVRLAHIRYSIESEFNLTMSFEAHPVREA